MYSSKIKNISVTFILALFLLPNQIFPQLNPDVAFYPLHVGDMWHYKVVFDTVPVDEDTTYYSTTEVTGREIINGQTYFIINNSDGPIRYLRIDSTDATVWEYNSGTECMVDSLSLHVNSQGFENECAAKFCVEDSSQSVFGESKRVKKFVTSVVAFGTTQQFAYAYGIGEIFYKYTYSDVWAESKTKNLVYAKVDGIEYGELLENSLNYYPLDIGNYWEYSTYYGIDPIHTEYSGSYWIKVIGDTNLVNNKNYKILEKGNFYDSNTNIIFERVDSATSSVYRFNGVVEYKIDSLACSEGDTINSSRFDYTTNLETYCTRIEEQNIFSTVLKVKYLNDNSGIPNTEYELAENIGLIANYSWEGSSWEEYLKYAKVKNVEYGTRVDVKEIDNTPIEFSLSQNYPNPFNPSTKIKYSIPSIVGNGHAHSTTDVTLKIYDILGREVATLVNKEQKAGNYEVKFDANELTSGIYFYRLQSGSFNESKKMLLVK